MFFTDPPGPSILEAADPQKPVIEIRAQGVEIRGLNIRGGREGIRVMGTRNIRLIGNRITESTQAGIVLANAHESVVFRNAITASTVGIRLEDAHQNRLVANAVRETAQGIVLQGSRANRLRANHVVSVQNEGLLLERADRNELTGNLSERNAWGLVLRASTGEVLTDNRLNGNTHPLSVTGERDEHFVHDIARDNTIDGRPVYYLVGERNVTITGRERPAYLALVHCEQVTVSGITLSRGVDGLLLIGTHSSTVKNSVIAGTLRGVYLLDSRGNTLVESRVERSGQSGVSLIRSHGNRLERNVIAANEGHGVLLAGSEENALVANEISRNKASGVHLSASRETVLRENRLQGNWVGVYLERGGDHTLSGNWIRESQFGIFVTQSNGNRFSGNHLENNRHDTNAPDLPLPPTAPSEAPPEEDESAAGGS